MEDLGADQASQSLLLTTGDSSIGYPEPEVIYVLATECNTLFSAYLATTKLAPRIPTSRTTKEKLSSARSHGKAIEECQQRFWAWASSLGVFAKPKLSLDTKLKGHADILELVTFLLDMIKSNLTQGVHMLQPSYSSHH